MFNKVLFLILLISFTINANTQNPHTPTSNNPKLVVGVVVDQMRYDFLYRYYDRLSENGLKRLITQGVNCINNQFNYTPTYTGPGHASIYTGSTPAIHGITSNNFYEKNAGKMYYCTEDSTVQGVGSTGEAGMMSPKNLKTTTISDQLKLATGFRSKVIGVALKDRGSILPAGHSADAAYWYDYYSGNFSTSTYYMSELPQWVKAFNQKGYSEKYLNSTWETLYPIASYIQSDIDNQPYEQPLNGEELPVFPHTFAPGKENRFELLATSPYGSILTADFAIAALYGEQLGKRDVTDFLAISFSSTDYIGHAFGPNSIEVEDAYLRLDREFEKLFNALDSYVGKNNYLLFLTADHGICDVPGHNKYYKLPGRTVVKNAFTKDLNEYLNQAFTPGKYIKNYGSYQYVVDMDLLKQNNISWDVFFETVKAKLLQYDGVAQVIDLHNFCNALYPEYFLHKIKNGINPKRSGDIFFILEPGWLTSSTTGTTHGSLYEYDSHVPLIFYGWNLKPKEVVTTVNITDIAPTIAAMLHILAPNGNIGTPIKEVIDAMK